MAETKKSKDKTAVPPADGCLGSLEHHVHSLFASERVPGDDYVYHPSTELFNALEDFCDDQTMNEPRQPLLVTGEHGTGKSALLANWLQRRQRTGPRGRAGDEFIFWHAVGSSRKSMEIHNLIRRLMRDLKKRFDIAREVPYSHAQLSWDLPRFLELASRKGKVIIVIDGIQRLTSQDGETGLSWLPLEFPPNVRVVVSAVSESNRNTDDGKRTGHSEKLRIMGEIERREWTVLKVKPLDSVGTRCVIESYMRKTVQADVSRVAGQTAAMLSNIEEAVANVSQTMAGAEDPIPGFMLFDTQINMIVNHPLSSNPLFLRTLLRCLYWGASHGYCLWTLLNQFLASESTEELIHTVFAVFEKGFNSSAKLKDIAREKCIAAGGVPSLRVLYPWHPSFQPKEDSAIEIQVADFQSADGKDQKPLAGGKSGRQPSVANLNAAAPVPSATAKSMGKSGGPEKLADEKIGQITAAVQQGAGGGMQWLSASEAAENELEYALINTQCALADLIENAEKLVPSYEGSSFIEVFLASQVAYNVPEALSREPSSMNLMYSNMDLDEESQAEEHHAQATDDKSGGRLGTLSESNNENANESEANSRVPSNDTPLLLKESSIGSTGSHSGSKSGGEGPRKTVSASHTQSFMKFGDKSANRQSGVHASFAPQDPSRTGQRPRLLTLENENDAPDGTAAPVDPLESYGTLPIYMRGGVGIFPGFGDLLGNSLSLLHAARHGLRETELWSMVSKLQCEGDPDAQPAPTAAAQISPENSTELKKDNNSVNTRNNSEENKTLLSICAGYCERFSEAWMIEDPFRRGTLSLSKLLVGMQRVNSAFGMRDLKQMLTLLSLQDASVEGDHFQSVASSQELTVGTSNGSFGNKNAQWDYQLILARLVQSQRLQKLSEAKAHLGKKGKLRLKKRAMAQSTTFESVDQKLFSGSADGYNDAALGSVSLPGSASTPNRNGGGTVNEGFSDDAQYSLGPVLEEGLLSVLCALGVLHSTEHHILVFPSEAQAMRGVVKLRYVQQRGGVYNWHNKLISYFNAKENCLRRCEELPWHMTICRKWFALRDTLSDLSAFDLMFKGDLREELIRYWTLLTFGPLYVSDEAQQEETNARLHKTETQLILSDLDTAVVLNLNEKQTRKQRLRGKVATFDVVEEYEKAVDLWVSVEHPNSKKMGQLLEKIARFLGEGAAPICTSGGGNIERMSGQDVITEEAENKNTYYYYMRWIWIQYPWLAMQWSGQILNMNLTFSSTDNAQNASGGDNQNSQTQADAANSNPNQEGGAPNSAPDGNTGGAEHQGNAAGLTRGASSVADARRAATMQRTWTMRKNEALGKGPSPELSKSLNQGSMTRMHSFINAGMTSQKNLDALESIAKQANEVPERVAVKYRRSLEQHESIMANIPHAQATTRSKNKKTMFPSVDAMYRDKKRVQEEEEINKLLSNAKPGDLESVASLLATNSLQAEIKQLEDKESLELINRARGGALPITNPSDVQLEAEAVRTAKLRSAYDKCRQMVRQKIFKLEEMVVSTEENSSNDEQVAALFESAEIAKASLDERYGALSAALDDAKGLNSHLTKLIAFLNVRPPYNERHVASLEQELVLAKQQFNDLMKYRSSLYTETEHIERVTGKKIKDRIKAIQQQRKVLRQKLKARRVAIARAQSSLVEIDERIKTAKDSSTVSEVESVLTIGMPAAPAKDWSIVGMNTAAIARAKIMASLEANEKEKRENTKSETENRPNTAATETKDSYDNSDGIVVPATPDNGNRPDGDNHSVGSLESNKSNTPSANDRANVAKAKLMLATRSMNSGGMKPLVAPSTARFVGAPNASDPTKARKCVEFILLQTGCNSHQDFIERYNASKKLQESLKSQQSLADSRIAQLNIEHAELVDSWNETNFVSSSNGTANDSNGTATSNGNNNGQENGRGGGEPGQNTHRGSSPANTNRADAINDIGGNGDDKAKEKEEENQPSSSSAERQMRYLDNKLFKAEMRLNHNARQSEKAVLAINEIKTGVAHLVSLLAINEKLLCNLPSSNAPIIRVDDDIAKNLSWCEERVLAINESMLLDNSKTLGDYSKPLHARQIELANMIEAHQLRTGQGAAGKRKRKKGANRKASLSTAILADFTDDTPQDNSVRVPAAEDVDEIFNQQVEEALEEHDHRAEDFEAKELALKGAESQEQAMVRLLGSALSGRESVRELRRANILGNKKLGRNAGYGWAVDDLLRLQHTEELKKKKQRDRANGVIDEGDEELSEEEDDFKATKRSNSQSPNKRGTAEVGEDGLPIPQPVVVPHAKRLDKNKVLSRSEIKSALLGVGGPDKGRKQKRDQMDSVEEDEY